MFGMTLTECWLVLCVLAVMMLGMHSYQRYQAVLWQQRLHAHQQLLMAAQQTYVWQQRQQKNTPQNIHMRVPTLIAQALLPRQMPALPMIEHEQLDAHCVANCAQPTQAQWVLRWTVSVASAWLSRAGAWADHLGWQPLDAQGERWYVEQPLQHFSRTQPSWSQAFAHANTQAFLQLTEEGA